MLRDLWHGLLELLAPPTCAACGAPLEAREDGFCEGCALLLDEFPNVESSDDRAAYAYGGPVAEAITQLKYRGHSHHARVLSSLLVDTADGWQGRIERVCVVPLHGRRLRERGFNQSALLAAPVARALGARFDPWLLCRTHETKTQVGANPVARRQQLRGSFLARPRARGANVLVVDDVRTTGATLHEARRALSEQQAGRVYTLTLAAVERN
ncbi:MAG: ComF family protein [Myxococcales bacterium]